jgi:microcystin degradation protein MlrC
MLTIAVGGLHHETNTFAPSKATLEDFLRAGGWPGLCRGEQLFEKTAGINLPITGFIEAARGAGHSLKPLLWANATPSNVVTEEAYETMVAMLLEDLAALRGLDALYLDLHGAMVTEHLEDGEGELLRRVRALVGRALPVVCSLDLHANITPQMLELSDGLVVFRTYPHVDMAATGKRAFAYLNDLLAGRRGHKAWRQLPFLIPLTAGCTLVEPAKGLYDAVERLEEKERISVSFACGFSPADIRDCGPSAVAYGPTRQAAEAAADAVQAEALAREAAFGARIFQPDEAVDYARGRAAEMGLPIVIADTQDNPGAGGDGNTVGLLRALVAGGAKGAVFGLLIDAPSAAQAHRLGEGSRAVFRLGLPPFETEAVVRKLGDGRFTCTGPFYEGARMELGPMALLDVNGVLVALASRKVQAADQEMFRCLGVEPARQPILALKSSVHFRAHFQPIAGEVIVAAAPGPNPVDHRLLAYKRLRKGVRLMPGGPAFAGASAGSA